MWQHEEETEGVDPIDSGLDCPGVPALVGRVQQTTQETSYKLAFRLLKRKTWVPRGQYK